LRRFLREALDERDAPRAPSRVLCDVAAAA
jgi:hypothetical protein